MRPRATRLVAALPLLALVAGPAWNQTLQTPDVPTRTPASASLASIEPPLIGAVPGTREVARLVALVDASADHCTVANAGSRDYRTLEADVNRFRQNVPAAADLPIELRDCFWDGMVVRGERIVLSTRLARATKAQRFFVIAHEFGHLASQHHARISGLVEDLLQRGGTPQTVATALRGGAIAPLSRRNELEADAFAVRLMLQAGEDPEEAARFLDEAARFKAPTANSHPVPQSRAAAIRAITVRLLAARD
jgi:Zn-dependent protease with chaperone function